MQVVEPVDGFPYSASPSAFGGSSQASGAFASKILHTPTRRVTMASLWAAPGERPSGTGSAAGPAAAAAAPSAAACGVGSARQSGRRVCT